MNLDTSLSDFSCSEDGGSESSVALCPESRSVGLKVRLITVKALLTADALRRLDARAYHFCPSPECDVVYFDSVTGSIYRKRDLRVRVGQKETDDPVPLCYCFDVTLADLRDQLITDGKTDVPANVAAEVRAGHCACEVRNPQGSCCLRNLSRAIEAIELASKARGISRTRTATPTGSTACSEKGL